jgi:hypothetical protein
MEKSRMPTKQLGSFGVVFALIAVACSGSGGSGGTSMMGVAGPECLALENCCNNISGVPDGGKLEAENCDSTQGVFTMKPYAEAEATCEKALEMYKAKHACP